MIFGRKSEKLTAQLEQLEFRLEELETAQAADEAAQDAKEASQLGSTQTVTKPPRRPARKPLPEDLPREVVTHLPAHNCCPDCSGALRKFGEDISEQLERIPASFKVIRHVRPKFVCVIATTLSRRPLLQDRSSEGCQVRASWLTYWSPSMATIFRSIVSQRSLPAKALILIAQRWQVGLVQPAICWLRWSTKSGSML